MGDKKTLCNMYNKLPGACTTEMHPHDRCQSVFYAGEGDFIGRREESLLVQGNEAHNLLVYGGL
jgi:hypothetical protein